MGHLLAPIVLLFFTFCGLADAAPVAVPEKAKANILKRHPDAHDLQASEERHFGINLVEVSYKIVDEKVVKELFSPTGYLFTNEISLGDPNEVVPAVKDSLTKAFPSLQMQKAEMISNPNGVGEEYEVYLTSGGAQWKVMVNGQGDIKEKYRY